MKVFVTLALGLALLVPGAARAHTTSILVYNNYVAPDPMLLEPGHDVKWTWSCGYPSGPCAGTHRLVAFEGATFDSGPLTHPATFTATMPAATTVRYRCTLHSTLSGTNCTGMCGVLSSDTQKPTGSVTSPTADQIFTGPAKKAVTFTGTAGDNLGVASVKLRIYDLLGTRRDFDPTCAGVCTTTDRPWTATIELTSGRYLAEVDVKDVVGNGYTSPRTTFYVL